MRTVEVAIVGGGPAGYVAARRLGQLGHEALVVERQALGGVCLNQGCIPTKALYAATEALGRTESFRRMGIELAARVNLDQLRDWTDEVIAALRSGVEKLLSAVGVEVIQGEARLQGPRELRIRTEEEEERFVAETTVLATGSVPIELPGLPFDGERVWSSKDALSLPRVPEHLVVVGGGVIGLELATVYRRLGSQVTVVEMMEALLPGVGLSPRGQAVLRQALRAQGIELLLGAAAQGLMKAGVAVRTEAGEKEIPCDAVLVAVGRRPKPERLGLESVGITPERGFVPTDEEFRAGEGVYAIGDLRGGPMLAHKASHEGLLLAERLAGREPSPIDYRTIPQAIFTHPEVGLVGLSEEEAKSLGIKARVGRFPMGALGRALAEGEALGHFQVLADEAGRILGAEIVGPHASDLIAEAALAVQAGLTLEQLAETVHAHPTFPEGLWEAALSALGRPLHAGR